MPSQIKSQIQTNGEISQIVAKQCLLYAKEHIDVDAISSFQGLCTFARNLMIAQFFSLLLFVFSAKVDCWQWWVGIVILMVIYYFEWRRKCDCYVRRCFSEFIKKDPKLDVNSLQRQPEN